MNKKEINACLNWHIRTRNGFYYNKKRYTGMAFLEDCLEIHTSDIKSIVYINYEDIVKIENVRVEENNGFKLHKTIFTK